MPSPPLYQLVHCCVPESRHNDTHVCPGLIPIQRQSGSNAIYECKLCDEVVVGTYQRAAHLRSTPHKRRTDQLREYQRNHVWTRCAFLQNRIDSLLEDDCCWRKDAESSIYWLLLLHGRSSEYSSSCRDYAEMLTSAEMLLDSYEDRLRRSLLEVAVWKAMCIANPPSTAVNSSSSFHEWQEWSRKGWKSTKKEMLCSKDITIVVRLVCRFFTIPQAPQPVSRFNAHQHLEHSIIEKRSSSGSVYICNLCNVQMSTWNERENHRRGDDLHSNRSNQISDMCGSQLVVCCCRLQLRIESLPYHSWRTDVESILSRAMLWHFHSSFEDAELTTVLDKACATLEAYEQAVGLGLLELAVWKAVCIAAKETLSGNCHEWKDWFMRGWKDTKSSMRGAQEIGIVIRSVMPYIEDNFMSGTIPTPKKSERQDFRRDSSM